MIDVDVTSTTRAPVPRNLIARAARQALRGRIARAQVSVAVVGDARMRRMNREALAHDYTTDVLSFHHGDTPEGALLELVVCLPFARRAALRHGVPMDQEIARYVVHGALHCAGLDDDTVSARAAMWAEQERVLRLLFGRRYRDPG